jgi:acyl-CoA reductase-like NAD-dependent aldehyde dehydrogenase
MGAIGVRQSREPLGVVLIVGPANYPLLLPGVQLIQALAAGNGVVIKPAPACSRVIERLVELCRLAGVPADLVHVLPSAPEAAQAVIAAGVDKVVLTGAYQTGQRVARQLAEQLTPATFELSGNDAVYVLEDADLDRVAKSVAYALGLNGGQTCIAPRRLFATAATLGRLLPVLSRELEQHSNNVRDRERARHAGEHSAGLQGVGGCLSAVPMACITEARQAVADALAGGAHVVSGELTSFDGPGTPLPIVLAGVTPHMRVACDDLFAPLLSLIEVNDMPTALEWAAVCPYALGASVFGSAQKAAEFAAQIAAGCVTINDVLVPTADPRVSFGGWKSSGYGVTRGLEGLREMSRLKVTCQRYGRWLPHLSTQPAVLAELMRGLLLMRHGPTLKQRWRGVKLLIATARQKRD